MYVLTLKSGKVVTRVQVGCLNEFTFDMLAYADLTGQFYSFKTVRKPGDRPDEEINRAASFVKRVRKWTTENVK